MKAFELIEEKSELVLIELNMFNPYYLLPLFSRLVSNENSQEDSPDASPLRMPWFQKTTKPSISTEPKYLINEFIF